jgi:hypothetical protein
MKEKELIELQHKYKMEEIEFKKKSEIEVEALKHNNQLELQRIRNASIERNILRKERYQ